MGKLIRCHNRKVDSTVSAYFSLLPNEHYNDVIMGAIASQITSLTIVYSTGHSDADQRKLQSSSSPVPGEFPAQMASNAENVSIWWRHREPIARQAGSSPMLPLCSPHVPIGDVDSKAAQKIVIIIIMAVWFLMDSGSVTVRGWKYTCRNEKCPQMLPARKHFSTLSYTLAICLYPIMAVSMHVTQFTVFSATHLFHSLAPKTPHGITTIDDAWGPFY